MRRFSPVLAGWLAAVLVASAPLLARAGSLDDALNSMFFSASVTNPAAYESQSRGGLVGGYMGARAPIKSINVINFSAPRLNAGCGGIDMYFGSFSFINSEQIQQLIRAIGANAIGYAFKSAIRAMCAQCASVLNDLETIINNINRSLKNTCSLAKGIVDTAFNPDSWKNKADETGSMLETAANSTSDIFESVANLFSSPDSAVKAAPEENPNAGNLVWKALYQSGVAGMIGNPDSAVNPYGSDAIRMAQYLMSMTGTIIIPTEQDPDDHDCSGDKNCNMRGVPLERQLTFIELYEGSEKYPNAEYWACNDTDSLMACQNPHKAQFSFKGIRTWVKDEFEAIVERVYEGQYLNSEQQYLLSIVPAPMLSHFTKLERSQEEMLFLKDMVLEYVTTAVAVKLGDAIVYATRKAFDGVENAVPPPGYQDNIRDITAEVNTYRLSTEQNLKVLTEMADYVGKMRSAMVAH